MNKLYEKNSFKVKIRPRTREKSVYYMDVLLYSLTTM